MSEIISQQQQIAPSVLLKGQLTDNHTRCVHYHLDVDVVAIKFKCCNTYYPCYKCHEELTTHSIQRFDNLQEKVILCGECYNELTMEEYFNCGYKCIHCHANFNPRCESHYGIYFDLK
ncbi:HOT13 Helper of Tim protein 13 [Candida maltosa Xu316]